MKWSWRRIGSGVLGLAAWLGAAPAGAVGIDFSPAMATVAEGAEVSFDLVVTGLAAGTAPSLGSWDVDVGFDPAALTLLGVDLSDALGDTDLGEALDTSLGTLGPGTENASVVSLLENNALSCIFCTGPYLDSIQGDSVILASFRFRVDGLAAGAETTVFVDLLASLGDGFGVELPRGAIGTATLTGVPEPATALLLAAGLAGLAARRGTRRSVRNSAEF